MKTPVKRSMPTKERRYWARLSLAIPVFVRGINGQGREFLEFSTLLNESAGGVLLAMRKPLRLWSRVSLEIPSSQILKSEKLRRVVRKMRARVIRITHVEGWNLCGLQFARPLV
jgi:PilZ domain